ncbi:phage portal protein, lambda family [Balnearium lithotrophicum]|uniref:Phage portal protein, lambda family n=1 Tax=Balnearium lithotrophicum TaxID=223788 RepID=A0A521CT40_9BACT|nr:phage portal protein [Balnearium lithotrophicum]SMO61800.1 phage portal protein, lambda family [Balnearium lithotrophicum]
MKVLEKVENLIGFFFPNWRAKREAFKLYSRSLKAAEKGRLTQNWKNWVTSPNSILSELSTVRSRANWLYENNCWVRASVDILLSRIVGSGTTLQALTKNEVFNDKAENLFKEWSYSADYYRQFHFGDIERLAILKLFTDGGVFFHIVTDTDNKDTAPFSIEVLEYGRLASFWDKPYGDNEIINGIEVDKSGKVVAYHFTVAPDSFLNPTLETKRVQAEDVIHFSPFRRPHQLLGIPLLAPVIPYAYHLDDLIEAELINAKVSASFGIAIKKNAPVGQFNQQTQQRELEIAPGMIAELNPGEDIAVIDPKRPGNTFDDFVKLILRGMGRAIGLSYEQISGDKSEVNYSSARHSELELRDFILPFRKSLERYFLRPVYTEFVKNAVSLGNLNIMGAIKDWRNWTAHRWIFKGFDWVDPLKEAQAKRLELLLGLTTLADEAAAKGKDWKELVKQRAKEVEFMDSLGLSDISETQVRGKKWE